MMYTKRDGLTVACWIITALILLVLFGVGFVAVRETMRRSKTSEIISLLHRACQSYEKTFYVFPKTEEYPDSRALHQHLGSKWLMHINYWFDSEADRAAWKPQQPFPPMVGFTPNMLDLPDGRTDVTPTPPVQIIDSWGNPIRYRNPGIHNKDGVDIWSAGPNGKFEANSGDNDHDDITNWSWKEDE